MAVYPPIASDDEDSDDDHEVIGLPRTAEAGPSEEHQNVPNEEHQSVDVQDVTVFNRVGSEEAEYHHYDDVGQPDGARVDPDYDDADYDDVGQPDGARVDQCCFWQAYCSLSQS